MGFGKLFLLMPINYVERKRAAGLKINLNSNLTFWSKKNLIVDKAKIIAPQNDDQELQELSSKNGSQWPLLPVFFILPIFLFVSL